MLPEHVHNPISTIVLDGLYLRLDCTNDPLTGDLDTNEHIRIANSKILGLKNAAGGDGFQLFCFSDDNVYIDQEDNTKNFIFRFANVAALTLSAATADFAALDLTTTGRGTFNNVITGVDGITISDSPIIQDGSANLVMQPDSGLVIIQNNLQLGGYLSAVSGTGTFGSDNQVVLGNDAGNTSINATYDQGTILIGDDVNNFGWNSHDGIRYVRLHGSTFGFYSDNYGVGSIVTQLVTGTTGVDTTDGIQSCQLCDGTYAVDSVGNIRLTKLDGDSGSSPTAGSTITMSTGCGGDESDAGTAGCGGNVTISTGRGGCGSQNSGSNPSGGGNISITMGKGGDFVYSLDGGCGATGGAFSVTTGCGGYACARTSSASSGNGGSMTLRTGGAGVAEVSDSGNPCGGSGGSISITTGSGSSACGSTTNSSCGGSGGSIAVTGGCGGCSPGISQNDNYGGGGAGVTIKSGCGGTGCGGTNGGGGSGGTLSIISGCGGCGSDGSSGQCGGTGGTLNLLSGCGGPASSGCAAGSPSAGSGGPINRTASKGGCATGAGGGTSACGGSGGSIAIKAGCGGSASSGATNYGGNGGTVTITSGCGGTGSSSNGTVGDIVFKGGVTTIMTIDGDNSRVGIGETAPQDKLELNGTMLIKDALKFTQDDGNEYIDSLNDGYMDYGATTAHRFNNDAIFTLNAGNDKIGLISTSADTTKIVFNENGTNVFSILYYGAGLSGDANLLSIRSELGTPEDLIIINGAGEVGFINKVWFTQTDKNEYIDSLNDGYMDYGATTAHRFNKDVRIQDVINFFQTGAGTSGNTNFGRNVYYDGSYKRMVADNDAMLLQFLSNGHFDIYTESDANTAADSVITFAKRFSLDTNGNLDLSGNINTTSDDNWDLNDYTAGAPTCTGYVTVTINGIEYKLLARLEP